MARGELGETEELINTGCPERKANKNAHAESGLLDGARLACANVAGINGVVDDAGESGAGAVELGVVRLADGHEVRAQAADPALADLGEDQGDDDAEGEQRDRVKEVDEEGLGLAAGRWRVGGREQVEYLDDDDDQQRAEYAEDSDGPEGDGVGDVGVEEVRVIAVKVLDLGVDSQVDYEEDGADDCDEHEIDHDLRNAMLGCGIAHRQGL